MKNNVTNDDYLNDVAMGCRNWLALKLFLTIVDDLCVQTAIDKSCCACKTSLSTHAYYIYIYFVAASTGHQLNVNFMQITVQSIDD